MLLIQTIPGLFNGSDSMKVPVFSLVACTFDKLIYNTPIFNQSTVEYFLWVKLPSDIIKDCELYQVDECQPNNREVNWLNSIERDHNKPWLKITFRIFSNHVGMHIYKLSFINRYTNDVVPLYIAYIIQDDNPDKPYVYMRKSDCEV